MSSDRDYSDSVASAGIIRVNAGPNPYQPIRFLSDGDAKTARQNQDHRSRSRAHHARKSFFRKGKRLLIAMIPFVLFMVGLSLVSVGFFTYVENESVLAVIITSRDIGSAVDLHGLDSSDSLSASPAETVAAPVSGEDRIVVPFYYFGDQLGTIRIHSVDIEVGVYQGDTEKEFRLGAGHFLGSFMPGQDGNIVLAAHRTSYFRHFEDLKAGDQVEFETTYGLFTYQVREIQILEKKDFDLITAETDQEQLTMYTCYPFTYIGNAPERYVVMCDLIGSELNK